MNQDIQTVKDYYDENAQMEWERLEQHPFEFIFTRHMLEKYIRSGDRVLDIGGGPGRYSIHFAEMGCDVTLVDLSKGNVALAKQKAAERGVKLSAFAANCLELDRLPIGEFDHVLLMGPLYHLKEDADRVRAVELALKRLKPGGTLSVSFIQLSAGLLFDLKTPGMIEIDFTNPETRPIFSAMREGGDYTGPAFTAARFVHPRSIRPFMEQFPLKELHLFGQEGVLSANEPWLLERSQAEIDRWIEVSMELLEVPELLALSEHLMYIGRKE